MDSTSFLHIDYLAANQSRKEILINEGFDKIDKAIQGLNAQYSAGGGIDGRPIMCIRVSADGAVEVDAGRVAASVVRLSDGHYRISRADGKALKQDAVVVFSLYAAGGVVYVGNVSLSNGGVDLFAYMYSNNQFAPADVSFSVYCH